jgi:hypothetical protein
MHSWCMTKHCASICGATCSPRVIALPEQLSPRHHQTRHGGRHQAAALPYLHSGFAGHHPGLPDDGVQTVSRPGGRGVPGGLPELRPPLAPHRGIGQLPHTSSLALRGFQAANCRHCKAQPGRGPSVIVSVLELAKQECAPQHVCSLLRRRSRSIASLISCLIRRACSLAPWWLFTSLSFVPVRSYMYICMYVCMRVCRYVSM